MLALFTFLLSSSALAQMNSSVAIQNFSFQPGDLTVPVGTTITWTNQDGVQHTVTSDNGTFDSNDIMPNNHFSYTFNQSGNYSYHCKIHPSMHGQIQVIQGSSASNVSSLTMSNDPPQNDVSVYSQYYKMMGGSAPKEHITTPKNYQMKDIASFTVHFNLPQYGMPYTPSQNYVMPSQYQTYTMPYSQYQQSYATYTGGNSLWIQGATSLTQYVTVPQGSSLSLIAISQTGGNGYLYEIAPSNKLIANSYYFYPYNQMDFYADAIGQYILLFIIDDKVSNAVVIDVVGSSGYQQLGYQQPGYNQPSYQQPGYQGQSSQPSSYSQPSAGYQSTGGY